MTATPYLYDQVKLTDSTQGVVKYIGEVKGENGTMFGLEMLPYYGGHDTAENNGTIGDQTYFTTTDNEVIGRFVSEDDIDDIIDSPTHDLYLIGEAPQFTVGDRCYIAKKSCNAMVHYVGIPKFSRDPKIFIGLELDEPVGNCNGTLLKCTYFECEDKYGLYQIPNNVALAQQEVNVDIDEVDEQNYELEEKEDAEVQAQRAREEQREQEERRQREAEERRQRDEQRRRREAEDAQRRTQDQADAQKRARDVQDAAERERRLKEAQEREKRRQIESDRQRKQQDEEDRLRRERAEAERERERKVREQQQRRAEEERKARQAAASQSNDDYKGGYGDLAAPKLPPRKVVDGDTETIYPTYMTNFCVKARTHHKLKNYKTINYSSRKFQLNDQAVQDKLEELSKKHIADRGHFILDGDKRFVYTLVLQPHEWRAAVRVNTDDIGEAKQCLEFIEKNTQNEVAGIDRIQKFNWDRNFQTLVSAIRKANM